MSHCELFVWNKKTPQKPKNWVCLIKCPLLWSIITSLFPGASSLIQQTFLSSLCTHQTDISLGSRELSSTQEGIKKSGLPFQILAFLLMSTLGNISWAMFSQSSSCLTHFLDLLVFPYLMTGIAFNLNQLCLNQAVIICSVVLNYTSAHYVWISQILTRDKQTENTLNRINTSQSTERNTSQSNDNNFNAHIAAVHNYSPPDTLKSLLHFPPPPMELK